MLTVSIFTSLSTGVYEKSAVLHSMDSISPYILERDSSKAFIKI